MVKEERKRDEIKKVKVAYIDVNHTLISNGVMYEEVPKFLKWLKNKGYVICAVSSLRKEDMAEMLEAFDIYDLFDVIISTLDYDMLKPDPRIINVANALIKDKLGAEIDKKKSILIGDRPDKDIKMGKLAGIKTIRIRRGDYQHLEPEDKYEIPHYEVRNLEEIKKILREKR